VGQVPPGEEAGYSDDDVEAAVVNNLVNDNSAINSDTNSAVLSWNGTWAADSGFAITLEGHGDAQLWVVGQGAATEGAYFVQGTKQGTVNLPGTHPRLLAVGCTVNRLEWTSVEGPVGLDAFGGATTAIEDSACYFSGAGPTPFGVPKPEIAAPGAFIGAAMGVDADPRTHDNHTMFTGASCPDDGFCNVLSDNYGIASGTSMSAPHVTGAVALLLEQDATLTQARATEILQASARKPLGSVPYGSQIGAGALDLAHALEALAEEPASGAPRTWGRAFGS
jgi:subtilisin family serine protease